MIEQQLTHCVVAAFEISVDFHSYLESYASQTGSRSSFGQRKEDGQLLQVACFPMLRE
jgi:hypothetical protein